jgi:WD40 repeat protein/DNA-binding SARP family transcriptional activator/energy-coupling factor transporter ATP-binding protein EcfA2
VGIGVLGPLTVDQNGALSPRDRVVLSALVVRHGTATSAEQLADALWGDQPPASWHKVVPGCVNRLRKVLGASAIITSANGYRLEVPDDELDVRRFERLFAKGHQMLALGEADRAILAFREALALWRGAPLCDVEEWLPARVEVERLEELRLEAEEAVIDASLRVGLQAGILAEARSRVAQVPVRERRWALLALAQYLSGAQADALLTLRRARELLTGELGLDPGPELAQLEQAVLRQDPSLTAATALPRPVARCPYPGLLPYDLEDADFFFGRSADLAACRRRLQESGVLVLVGPSGSGKSSLLRAGLAASLVQEGIGCAIVASGIPETELLAEIESGTDRNVLVLDQVEEVVARLGSRTRRARLAEALVACAGRRPLALAIRADRFGDLAELPGFSGLVERGLVLLGPLGEEALRQAIEGPAREAALLLEPGLVDVLLQDVRDDPGALPLLSHALRETWERREGRTLTVEGYRVSGGIRGAVARSAEQVYDDLPDEDRAKLRGLMLRLLTLAPDGEPLRSAVPRGAIPADAAHEQLVERLVQARLVTADADVLDLAHETLARAWPRLRDWLDDDLEGQRILRHLSTAAESWRAMGRPDAELYRGDRLARAGAWQAASGADLTDHETDFLVRSREVADAAAAEVARAASARRRTQRRAAVLVAVATSLALVAGIASWMALRERDQRAQERQRADLERLVSSARRAATVSQSTDDPVESLLLGVEAVRRDYSADTQGTLLAALTRSPALVRTVPGGFGVAASADGTRLFVFGDPPRVVDTTSFATVATDDDAFDQLLDEPGVFTWNDEGGVYVELPGDGHRTLHAPGMENWQPTEATSDSDGRRIAAGFERESSEAHRYESAVVVWDLDRKGRAPMQVRIPGAPDHGGIHDFALDPGGARLYLVADKHAWLRAYDAGSGKLLGAVPAPVNPARDRSRTSIRISHDGRALIANDGADVVIVDTETMDVATRLRGHTHQIVTLEFSPDDRLVAASALDGSTLVWDRDSGALLERLEGVRLPAESLAFSPDSRTLYAAVEGSILVWDLEGSRRFVSTVNEPVGRLGYLVVPAPDGRSSAYFRATITSLGRDRTFDLVTARGRHVSVDAGFANWGAYSPAGDLLATVVDRRLQVWDPKDGRLLRQTKVPGVDHAEAAAFTADGSWIVVADRDGIVQAVDTVTLAPVGERVTVDHDISDLVPVPDGTDVVALVDPGDDGTEPHYVLVDPATGRVEKSGLSGDGAWGYAAISPDGQRLAVTQEGLAGLVDLRTGQWRSEPVDAHGELATRVAFSGDGTRFATSGFDGRVVLWNGITGARLGAVQPGGPEFETGVVFLPDGHTVQIATSSGQMFRWDTDPEAWVSYACRVAGRNLAADEWREVFGSEPYRKTCEDWPSGDEA